MKITCENTRKWRLPSPNQTFRMIIKTQNILKMRLIKNLNPKIQVMRCTEIKHY